MSIDRLYKQATFGIGVMKKESSECFSILTAPASVIFTSIRPNWEAFRQGRLDIVQADFGRECRGLVEDPEGGQRPGDKSPCRHDSPIFDSDCSRRGVCGHSRRSEPFSSRTD